MAEKKVHKIVSASSGKDVTKEAKAASPTKPASRPTGNPGALRLGAILLWIAAIAFEVMAILLVTETIGILPAIEPIWKALAALVLDLICVVIGSQLWKKANHIDPASQKNPTKFWIHNNLGVIISVLAFLPFVIILLTSKKTDKKSKIIGSVAALVFAAIAGLTSVDWNPVSLEALQQADAGTTVYWTEHGKKFHLYEDCQALQQTDVLTTGTAQEAMDANRTSICKFCEKRYEEAQSLESVSEDLLEAAGE